MGHKTLAINQRKVVKKAKGALNIKYDSESLFALEAEFQKTLVSVFNAFSSCQFAGQFLGLFNYIRTL